MAKVWKESLRSGLGVLLLGMSITWAGTARAQSDCPIPFDTGGADALRESKPEAATAPAARPLCIADFYSEGIETEVCKGEARLRGAVLASLRTDDSPFHLEPQFSDLSRGELEYP